MVFHLLYKPRKRLSYFGYGVFLTLVFTIITSLLSHYFPADVYPNQKFSRDWLTLSFALIYGLGQVVSFILTSQRISDIGMTSPVLKTAALFFFFNLSAGLTYLVGPNFISIPIDIVMFVLFAGLLLTK